MSQTEQTTDNEQLAAQVGILLGVGLHAVIQSKLVTLESVNDVLETLTRPDSGIELVVDGKRYPCLLPTVEV